MAAEPDSATLAQPQGWPRRFTVVLFFFTCALILYIDRASSSVVGPILMEEFGWDSATMGTIPGILAPAITGFIVQFTGSWDLVFYLATGLSGFGARVWLLSASGEQVFE